MARFAVYLTGSGTPTARPVVGDFDVENLPADTFIARRDEQVAVQVGVGQAYIQVPDTQTFPDLDSDTNTNDWVIDSTATPPVAAVPVSVSRYTLAQKQGFVRERRDILIDQATRASHFDRFISDTDMGTYATYISSLRGISDTEANPDAVIWPTLGAIAGAPDRILARTYRRGNVIGAVNLSGGIPTGEIFETATTVNGLYYRTTDGFQACRARIFIAFFNGTRCATTWTYPAAFIAQSTVSVNATLSGRNLSNVVAGLADTVLRGCQIVTQNRATTSIDVHMLSHNYTFVAGDGAWCDLTAIGRWTT